jgi:hypothetical protein
MIRLRSLAGSSRQAAPPSVARVRRGYFFEVLALAARYARQREREA